MTRRRIQMALGLLWLLDGALQLQPYMFGRGFADQVIAPAGSGQPGFVAAGVSWAADLVAAHPIVWDSGFAAVQLAIGIGLLIRPTPRAALLVSVAWALGVWYLGEGIGGLGSGHADLLTGAPGAVLLYAALALAAWPRGRGEGAADRGISPGSNQRPAAWLPLVWATLWIGGAVLRLLPAQGGSGGLVAELTGNAEGAPGWMAHLDLSAASALRGAGSLGVPAVVVLYVLIGVGGLVAGRMRTAAAAVGLVLALAFWLCGQSLGELYTGQSTDPDSGPLIVLLALALPSVQTGRSRLPLGAAEPPPPDIPGEPKDGDRTTVEGGSRFERISDGD